MALRGPVLALHQCLTVPPATWAVASLMLAAAFGCNTAVQQSSCIPPWVFVNAGVVGVVEFETGDDMDRTIR